MQREQLQTIAFGAGLMAVIIAIATGQLPRWLRTTLILGLVILACGGACMPIVITIILRH